MELKRIDVGSAAKVAGALYGALGLVTGGFIALFSLFGAGLASMSQAPQAPAPWAAGLLGLGAIVFFPLIYGVMGLAVGAVMAALYNLVAKRVGGLNLELG